jgi:hypothetical protein
VRKVGKDRRGDGKCRQRNLEFDAQTDIRNELLLLDRLPVGSNRYVE